MFFDGAMPVDHVRRKVALARMLLAHGRDPLDVRQRSNTRTCGAVWTFERCAAACIEDLSHKWKNQKHREQWTATLGTHASALAALPVAAIGIDDVKPVLSAIWSEKQETARRLAGRISAVLAWAVVHGHRTAGPCPVKLVRPFLVASRREVEHHKALPVNDAPRFWIGLRMSRGGWQSVGLLGVTMLTGCRSGESRVMRWRDLDFDRQVWMVPAGATKSGRAIDRPLTPELLSILENARFHCQLIGASDPDDLVFPGPNTGRTMSSEGLAKIMQTLCDATPHGLRSTFLDWARRGGHSEELARLQMGHSVGDKTRQAYARDTLLEQRRALMLKWERYLIG